jgi:hypothetical protein
MARWRLWLANKQNVFDFIAKGEYLKAEGDHHAKWSGHGGSNGLLVGATNQRPDLGSMLHRPQWECDGCFGLTGGSLWTILGR